MRWVIVVLVSCLGWNSAPGAEELKRPTLEALFADHTLTVTEPAAVRWVPGSGRFLFRTSEGESEILWMEDAESGEQRRLAVWSEVVADLRRQRPERASNPLGNVNAGSVGRYATAIAPDGTALAGLERGDLYRFDLEDGTARFLTDDAAAELWPQFSPDGSRVAFVKDGDLHWIDLATGVVHRLTDRATPTRRCGEPAWVYEEELGLGRAFWWSPDGARIAFFEFDSSGVDGIPITTASMPIPGLEEQRYPKAGRPNPSVRLGVVDASGGDPVWVDVETADHYLPRAGWTPDGLIWFQRLNRDQNELDLMTADPESGDARLLTTDRDPAWVNVRDDLTFLPDGRFLWTSERDGWNHLSLFEADGSRSRQLTEGPWQVDGVIGTDEEGRQVIFRANPGDLRQRHLFALDLESGDLRRLDREGGGVHQGLLSSDGRWMIDTWSALDLPPRADLIDVEAGAVSRILWRTDDQLEDWDLLPVETGTLVTEDGVELHTQLIRPRNWDPNTRSPMVLYVYGGPHSQLTADRWGGSIHHTYRVFAEMGVGVFLVDNRGTWGRGRAFERAIHRRLGQLEVVDQLAALGWLKAQPWVDPDRIVVYGGSFGGTMTLMLLLEAPEAFAGGIAYAPVTDWRLYDSVYAERYMDTPEDNPVGYDHGAPLLKADRLQSDLLIAHGTRDNNVHIQNTLQMVAALAGADRPFELMVYPQTRHGVRWGRYALHFHRLKVDFLRRVLDLEPASDPPAGPDPGDP